MRNRKRPPTHPGSILKRHYMEPLALTVSDLSEILRVSRKTLSKIINERGSITPAMALRLSKAFMPLMNRMTGRKLKRLQYSFKRL